MAKQSFISHVVNGYSRYDVPESKAFSCSPGPLYPVRVEFINARDRVRIAQGVDVRSNPLAVPSFNPYTLRLHRFWVPLQLYHPEMRTNSSQFDMNNLSLNWIPCTITQAQDMFGYGSACNNSLFHWLRVANKQYLGVGLDPINPSINDLPASAKIGQFANCDSYLAYWDIVRNYYSYSQWSLFSFAWPGACGFIYSTATNEYDIKKGSVSSYFFQRYGNLQFLDAYYESQFYPNSVKSANNTYNRSNLFTQIVNSDAEVNVNGFGRSGDGFPVADLLQMYGGSIPDEQLSIESAAGDQRPFFSIGLQYHPLAVAPSAPDRFSRLIPTGTNTAVSMDGITTIPQLAVASRLQEYKDLLGAGGNRYSDWLETFFAAKIEHVDRPKLLFSASVTVNAQVVMNQSGYNNNAGDSVTLGSQGGAIAFNTKLGSSQSYYFREPGYMIDILSIRPVYYWSSIRPDYLDYQGSDYFNPIYNDIGYQDVPAVRMADTLDDVKSLAVEPCFNEFRSSYDEVLGQLSVFGNVPGTLPLYSYWVQQRSLSNISPATAYFPTLFVDMSTVNSPFKTTTEDNFFVNLSYSVYKKNLVNKTFATRLSNR